MNMNPQDMTFVMLDLETLSRRPNAVVASLGAVAYQRGTGIFRTLELHFNLDEQIEAGRHIQGETITWWMDQDDEARKATFTNNIHSRLSVAAAREVFCNWYAQVKNHHMVVPDELYVMAMGNDFDLPILESLFGKVPYHYRKKMCWRTIYNLYRGEFEYPEGYVKHDALADARVQAYAHLQLLDKFPERLSWVKSKAKPAA